MARENQGLHIALIIFVGLTLVLAGTTFMFFRKFEEATVKAKTNQDTAQADRLKAESAEKDNTELKRIIGFGATDKMDSIHEEVNKEMETYAANFQDTTRDYRKVLKFLFEVIRKKDSSLAETQAMLQDEKTKRELVEAAKQSQVDQFKAAQDAAQKDLVGERDKFNQDREATNQQKTELAQKLDKAQKEAVAMVDKIKQNLDERQKQIRALSDTVKNRSDQLAAVTRTTFEDADGKVRWVSQRNGTVWINLGQADGLTRQTTFAVFPAEASDMAKAEKKAGIEITQILGDHLAEARVVDDKITNPILPGDLIYTPIWSPGEHLSFALTDGMDVDGDGKSDLEIVRNLITMAGGVVTAELSEAGKRSGKIDTNTRYLIKGRMHDENTPAEVRKERGKMIDEANKLGVQQVELAELLNRMGWKNQTPVVRYGPGANPEGFRPQPPSDRVPPTSRGSVSPVFQPRKPPRSPTGNAY
ncbi:MAG: hypothetical protein ABFD16_00170 [Thermoguttaceae bacterium]|jgi:hypothetical protein